VNSPTTFLGISKVSDGGLAFGTSGPNSLTSALVGANTLLPGTEYDLDIVYSARISTGDAGFGTATSFAAYDVRTDPFFTTAALDATPEPASFGLAGLGALLVALRTIRKRIVV
jgi:PEP-CTERM motif